MNATQLLALLTQATQLATTIAAAVAEAKEVLSSDDEALLKTRLAELREANDQATARVQEKLAAAAQRE